MKFLGHAWVAISSVPNGEKNLLILGSLFPEMMWYVEEHPFTRDEIHEGGV